MKVAFIFSAALSPVNGENIRGRELLNRLLEQGHRVDLVAPDSDVPDHPNLRFFRARGGKRYSTKSMVARHLKFSVSSPLFLPRLNQDYDLIYCFGLAGAVVAYPLALLKKKPLVCDFYEQDFPEYHSEGSLLLRIVLAGASFFSKIVLRRADRILVLTRAIKKDQRAIHGSKLHVVYDAADQELLDRARAADRQPSDGPLTFLFHGGIEKRDGLVHFLTACRTVLSAHDFRVLIVGTGRDLEACTAFVAADPVLHRAVTFTGWVDYEKIAGYLNRADVGILPSVQMPINALVIPRKLFEYIGWCIPVIVSDFPSIREVLGDDEAFFVEAENVGAIAAAIESCVTDPRRIAERRSKLQERASLLSLQRGVEKIAGIFDELANAS